MVSSTIKKKSVTEFTRISFNTDQANVPPS